MNSVAAKVPQEIAVLLQHHDIDSGARQQEPEHHPGRPAAGNAASRFDVLHGLARSLASARDSEHPVLRSVLVKRERPVITDHPLSRMMKSQKPAAGSV